jgi:signal transduction histidine kinase
MADHDRGADHDRDEETLASTLRLMVRPLRTALVSPAASRDPNRPWPPVPLPRRWLTANVPFGTVAQAIDLIIAVFCFFATYSVLIGETTGRGSEVWTPLLMLAALVTAVPIALRERHPMAAWRGFVAGTILCGPHYWQEVPFGGGPVITGMLVLYTVASRCPGHLVIGVGLWSALGVVIIDRETPGTGVLVAMPLAVGYLVQFRRNARRQLAEQERRHQDAQAVLRERQRIARELHDVVAHHMSMIAIQAEAAPMKVAGVPAETREDLAVIRATALDALTELRRVLGVLRSEDGSLTVPQPDLARLEELLAGGRGAGLRITSRLEGDLDGLPSGVGLTAYRIVQEALSNAMRHAPGSAVDVAIVREGAMVRLDVVSGPPGHGHRPTPSPPGGGHGLMGMRERAAMLGGRFSAEPTPEGGFAVRAALPVTAAETGRGAVGA